ncbi:MAG: 5-oxoproline transporter, DUF969 family subunit, partial [Allosphingosinicella sp.]
TLEAYGISLSPLELAVWAIPTAIAAFIVHSTRLMLLDRSLARIPRHSRESGNPATASELDSRFRGNDGEA